MDHVNDDGCVFFSCVQKLKEKWGPSVVDVVIRLRKYID